ncbi:hypothetical protein D3C80_1255680 [compost metagenome]
MLRQRLLHGIQVGGFGDEQGRTVLRRLEILRTGFDGGHFRIGVRGVRGRLDHADVVEVPGYGTGSPQLALAERHADFSHGAVDVVGHTLNDQRHLVRCKTFVGYTMVLNGFAQLAGAFLDGAFQGLTGHRSLFRLLDHQAQVRVGRDIGAVTRSNGDFFHQLTEDLALGVGCRFFVFNLPLCAHYSLS